jgi:hypothetical protein
MTSKTSGAISQLTGRRAESKVADALLDAEVFCTQYVHDRGEDLIVELGGFKPRSDNGHVPQIGLLQIKGHDPHPDFEPRKDESKRRLQLTHLHRWAALPLPVFVVAVDLYPDGPRFFAQSVDLLVSKVAPDGLATLEQDTITVTVPNLRDLASFLTREIESFYSAQAPRLVGLSESVVVRNHYEILEERVSFVPPTAKVWMKQFFILWKSPWRPAFFWVTINHLADLLIEKEETLHVPLLATIHVYRSLRDKMDNNAVAHLSWIEESHPEADDVRTTIDWPKATNWIRFRFNLNRTSYDLPDYGIREMNRDEFLSITSSQWHELEAVHNEFIVDLSDSRLREGKRESISRRLSSISDARCRELTHPPSDLEWFDELLTQYLSTLNQALDWLVDRPNVSEVTRRRRLDEALALALSHCGSHLALSKLANRH